MALGVCLKPQTQTGKSLGRYSPLPLSDGKLNKPVLGEWKLLPGSLHADISLSGTVSSILSILESSSLTAILIA